MAAAAAVGPIRRFVFLGAPGVGKGTFAGIIAPRLVGLVRYVCQLKSVGMKVWLDTSSPPMLKSGANIHNMGWDDRRASGS